MALNFLFFPLLLIIISLCFSSSTRCAAAAADNPRDELVRSSCIHASYPRICLRTLCNFDGPANTPKDLAQAAVTVSLTRARQVSDYLVTVRSGSKREQSALRDCVDQVGDSVEELRKTLSELQHVRSSSGAGFKWQMSNAETWVSAALTNEDTCLDGFRDIDGKVRYDVKKKITNVAKVTSNALYLINRLDP